MRFLILRLQFMLPAGHWSGYWDHHLWHHPHAPHRSLSLLFCFPPEKEREFTFAAQMLWVRYACLLEKSKENHDNEFQSKWCIFLMSEGKAKTHQPSMRSKTIEVESPYQVNWAISAYVYLMYYINTNYIVVHINVLQN